MPTYQPTYGSGTDPNYGLAENQSKAQSIIKRQQCEADGGVWNEEGQVCTFPTGISNSQIRAAGSALQQKQPEAPPQGPPNQPQIIRNQDSGKISGVILPDGHTLLGVDPKTLNAVLGKNTPEPTPQGTVEASAVGQQANQQQAIQEALAAAQRGIATPEQLALVQGASPDIGQALGAGAIGAVPGLIGGAVAGGLTGAGIGAAAGAVGGAGVGAIPGAVVGGIVGAVGGALTTFLTSTKSNIAGQQTEEFARDTEALRKGDRYLRALVTDTNRNPQNAPQNIALFYQTLNMIDAAHAKTWKDSQENLNRFLGKDGTQELARFEVFDSTMRTYYIQQFQTALAAPNPNLNLVTPEELGLEIQ